MGDAFERFSRQLTLPGFSVKTQRRLAESRVLVAGVGGLGGPLALELAAAGVGELILIHEGELKPEDLNRQVLMPENALGEPRAFLAKETIRRFNGSTSLTAINGFVKDMDLESLPRPDLIADCRHNFEDRRALWQFALKRSIPLLEIAMYAFEGQIALLEPPKTPCPFCTFPSAPPWDPRFGVLGAHAGFMGCLGALTAIEFLGMGRSEFYGTLGLIKTLPLEIRKIKLKKRRGCPCLAC